jgi:hypothetical protein
MQLSELELKEVENFTTAAPGKFPGLVMDQSPQGRGNASQIAGYIDGRQEKFTAANLDAAVIALQQTLSWVEGYAPTAPTPAAQDTRTKIQRSYESMVPINRNSHSDTSESQWAKDIREGRKANADRLAAQAKKEQRYRETHQSVVSPSGRIDYAQQMP